MCRSAEPGICLGKMEELVALCPADAGIVVSGRRRSGAETNQRNNIDFAILPFVG